MIILFTPPSDKKILDGKKTMTARHWLQKPPQVGDIIDAQTGYAKNTRFARLKIIDVWEWDANAAFDPTDDSIVITEDIGRKEGFDSADEFQCAYFDLNKHNWDEEKRIHYFIEFELHEAIAV